MSEPPINVYGWYGLLTRNGDDVECTLHDGFSSIVLRGKKVDGGYEMWGTPVTHDQYKIPMVDE